LENYFILYEVVLGIIKYKPEFFRYFLEKKIMKKDIHPEYYTIKAVCACGNEMEIGSVFKELKVEICAACHPFFTGKQKVLDTAGRIDKFNKRYAKHFENKKA